MSRRLNRDELHDRVVQIVNGATDRQVVNILAAVEAESNKAAARSIKVFVEAARGNIVTVKSGSRAMRAAQRGETYDQARAALFARVAETLARGELVQRFVTDATRASYVPFYEAYFSNYIEGSTLTLNEAERVIFEHAEVNKPEDSHDIRASWQILSDDEEMSRRPRDADDFLAMLRDRHRAMMAAHPQMLPGQWKTHANRAGATEFVAPEHVPGTLRAGWEEGEGLSDPFQRAVYLMFLVSEVHPFADGNGRSARVAMNTALVPAGMHRIVIPPVLRIDYMSALRRTTAGNGPEGLYRVLDHAQDWVSRGEFSTLSDGDQYLQATNALWDAGVAERDGVRLKLLRHGELFELPEYRKPLPAP